jgi:MFS family permease
VSSADARRSAAAPRFERAALRRFALVALLGWMTILAYGSTYYLLTVLGPFIVGETGWSLPLVVGGLSLGLLVSGVASPWVGRRIEALGGRAVLPLGCLVTGFGLLALGLAGSLWLYALAWVLIGLGMAATFYEAVFAALGRQFGQRARGLITLLTLFGGFASTICWPISAALVEWLGWRGACFVYAAAMAAMAVAVRLCLARPPGATTPEASAMPSAPGASERVAVNRRRWMLIVLGFVFALSASITAVVSVHLIALLGARDVGLGAAVAIGALIGPSQVGARALEYLIGRKVHPLWTLVTSTVLMALGLGLLAAGWAWAGLAIVLYGGGVGLKSIVSGTVPLVLVGSQGYATVMGRLAAPSLAMQALAPIGAAQLLASSAANAELLLWMLAGCALLNLLLGLLLLRAGRPSSDPPTVTEDSRTSLQ